MNSSSGGAGAIYGGVYLNNVLLDRNKAFNGGAIIASNNSYIENSTMTNNVAITGNGGAILQQRPRFLSSCSIVLMTFMFYNIFCITLIYNQF